MIKLHDWLHPILKWHFGKHPKRQTTSVCNQKIPLTHAEVLIHSHRLRVAVSDIRNDINKFGKYLDTLSSGKLSPTLVDHIHLCDELLRIQKELPQTIELPENPANNIWHYYKYLTVSFVPHTDKIILMIRLPLVDSDSSMPYTKSTTCQFLTKTLENLSSLTLKEIIWLSQMTIIMPPYPLNMNL